jgi:hypothetical protein
MKRLGRKRVRDLTFDMPNAEAFFAIRAQYRQGRGGSLSRAAGLPRGGRGGGGTTLRCGAQARTRTVHHLDALARVGGAAACVSSRTRGFAYPGRARRHAGQTDPQGGCHRRRHHGRRHHHEPHQCRAARGAAGDQQEALDRGLANIRRNYQGALRKGTLTKRPRASAWR